MNAAGRLAAYGAALVVAFGGAFGLASAVVPDGAVEAWRERAGMDTQTDHGHDSAPEGGRAGAGTHAESAAPEHSEASPGASSGGHGGHGETPGASAPQAAALPGLSQSAQGYQLAPVSAPAAVGEQGTLSFRILGPDGAPVTDFALEHEKELHLIVVRSDGEQFRHVHPELAADGTWSLPWQWEQAGTYRVYADFTADAEGAGPVTLTRTVQVAGEYRPVAPQPARVDEVDGYTVTLEGDLAAGTGQELRFTVTRDGQAVTALEPYLGASGHLVALREGDLAYLHVHPEGEAPQPGTTTGPTVAFHGEAPTEGRYLLYLDFQIDGQVRTARFVVDTAAAPAGGEATDHDDHEH